jgi:hypothetical protein
MLGSGPAVGRGDYTDMTHFIDLLIIQETYMCLFFKQNGEQSLYKEAKNKTPQQINIECG